jgi:hypothetical protein
LVLLLLLTLIAGGPVLFKCRRGEMGESAQSAILEMQAPLAPEMIPKVDDPYAVPGKPYASPMDYATPADDDDPVIGHCHVFS